MTISTTSSQVILLGNGSTLEFGFNFVGVAASDIEVVYTNASGIQTVLSSSQYTLFLNPPAPGALWGIGGTVTYPTSGSPIADGTSVTIKRILPLTQNKSISNQGDFYPQTIEAALDTLCMEIQQVSARTGQLRGIWQTDIGYNYADIVIDGPNGADTGNFYMCALANTSGVWATDLANGDWILAFEVQQFGTLAATQVTYQPPFTGALETTVQVALDNEPLNVLYGMTAMQQANVLAGLGTLDVTAALQAAIDSGYGNLYFPAGKYLVTTLNPVSNQHWQGAGYATTELVWSVSNQPTTQNMILSTGDLSNFSMDAIGLTGSLLSQTDPDFTGQNLAGIKMRAGSAQDIRVTNCRIRQFGDQSKDGGFGILIAPSSGSGKIVKDIFIQNNVIEDIANTPGIYVAANNTNVSTFENVHVDNNTIRINTNYSRQNAIYILCDTSITGSLFSVNDNVIEAAYNIDTAIEINYITSGSVCRNKIVVTGAASLVGILLRGNVLDVVVADNTVINQGTGCTTTTGITLLRFNPGEVQQRIIVANNIVTDFGSNSGVAGAIQIDSGSDTVQVIGNQVIGSNIRSSVGISVTNADQVNLSNNQVTNANVPVSLSAASAPHANITIENNKFQGCGLSGSGLIVTVLANAQLTNVVIQNNQAYNSAAGTTFFTSPSFLTINGNIVRNNISTLEEVNPSYFASVSWQTILEGSAVPGTVTVNSGVVSSSFAITVTGAQVTGAVIGLSCSVAKGALIAIADVTATNTVTVYLYNPTGSPITVTSPTWYAQVRNQ